MGGEVCDLPCVPVPKMQWFVIYDSAKAIFLVPAELEYSIVLEKTRYLPSH